MIPVDRVRALHAFKEQLIQVQRFASVDVKDDRYILLRTELAENVVIYFVDSPLSNRAIQQALRDNTMRGIFSLFVLDIMLLPQDKERFAPNGFIHTMQTLFHGKVYAYTERAGGLEVQPILLRKEDHSNEKKVVYDSPINPAALSCGHVETSFPMQGFWGTANFKAQVEYEGFSFRQRSEHSQRHRSQSYDKGREREAYHHLNQGGGARKDHYQILGVAINASQAQIRSAYRRLARQYHPDLNASPEAKDRMQEINIAYKALMRQFE